jgi:hypothetical protein
MKHRFIYFFASFYWICRMENYIGHAECLSLKFPSVVI